MSTKINSDRGKALRVDIQALRGLAVLLVVLYHSKIGFIDAGYLGVDIFFVISGFLITSLVVSGLERGDFSLSEFYARRAKRLLPAAYVTFAVTTVLAPWFLNQAELRDFADQILGAVTFTGNIVLWQQTGYFEGPSDLKPLLHVWSLSLEEQYYFLLPAALLLTPRCRWFQMVIALAVLSLGLCIAGVIWKPVATFYLLPTRAWELLLGSIAAVWLLRTHTAEQTALKTLLNFLFPFAVICLLTVPFMPLPGSHPGINALLVCLATVIVILANNPRLNSMIPARILARVGDISYSLYLVHWPIIAFLKNAWIDSDSEVPLALRLSALALSIVSAIALYHWIENPIHRSKLKLTRPLIMTTVLASIMLMITTPLVLYGSAPQIDFKEVRRINNGFSDTCKAVGNFEPTPQCQSTDKPNLLVWGDSYAMHLIPGIAEQWKSSGGVIQATRSQCGPLLGLAPYQRTTQEQGNELNQNWAESCIAFNESVVEYLKATPEIEFVVLSSPFYQYVTPDKFDHVIQNGENFIRKSAELTLATSSLVRTIEQIREIGKKVVIIAPPPASGFNIGGCLERQLNGTIALGGQPDCLINIVDYHKHRHPVLELLERTETQNSANVIRFDSSLCDATTCVTYLDGTILYRDEGHLSVEGSKLLARKMDLSALIREQAY